MCSCFDQQNTYDVSLFVSTEHVQCALVRIDRTRTVCSCLDRPKRMQRNGMLFRTIICIALFYLTMKCLFKRCINLQLFSYAQSMVGEVEDLRKMMESLKRMVTGQGLEEKRGETGDQEASLEEAEEKEEEKSVGEKTRENSSTDNKDGKRIRPGAQMIATHDYKKNPESPVGNELDVNEGDTLVYLMTNENNAHWWLTEDGKGQVGYVPATYLKIIRDVTRKEEENDPAGKEGYGKKTDGSKIGGDMGQDGERRKTYSAAVIEGFKRNSAIYVGDSIVRKTDSRLNKGEDVVVCLPGAMIEHVTARIEHVMERVEQIMGRGYGGSILVHVGTNNADKEGTTAIVEKYKNLLKKTKQARVGQIILSGILPVFGNRIQGYRNSKQMAVNGMVKRLCKEEELGYVDLWDSFVGKEEMYMRDGLHLSGKGAAVFAEGLSKAVATGLGKVRYLN